MEYKSIYISPFGKIILSSDGKYLTGLWFDTTRFEKLRIVEENKINDELEIFKKTKEWLNRYFNGEKPNLNEIPIKVEGTEFSKMVWNILKDIPYGKTITYGDIARKIELERNIKKMSAQAVGHAVGYNKISIIIPCHRVIGKNGKLIGYGSGIDVKLKLLKHENAEVIRRK